MVSNKPLLIKRTYQSISEAFAILGGLFNFLFLVGKILKKSIITIKKTNLNLTENFEKKNTNKEVENFSRIKEKNLKQDSFILKHFSNVDLDENVLETKEKEQKSPSRWKRLKKQKNYDDFKKSQEKAQKEISFNIFEYLKLYLKQLFGLKLTVKEELIFKSQKAYDAEIDISNILKRCKMLKN